MANAVAASQVSSAFQNPPPQIQYRIGSNQANFAPQSIRQANIQNNAFPCQRKDFHYDAPINNNIMYAQPEGMLPRIPVNHWRIVFSGDEVKSVKNDLGIHDFLAQVDMFRQAEQMGEQQLLQKIPHLLIGSARTWYTLYRHRILTWNDFVVQIKQRFLSTDYNYLLYSEVQNRKQAKNEPIGTYIADMQSKFRAMSNPPDEHHRLYIVRNNMLFEHSMALATMNVASIEQLEMLVKQRESARASQMAYRRQMNAFKPNVNELEEASATEVESESENIEDEACAMETNDKRKFRGHIERKAQNIAKGDFGKRQTHRSTVVCYNCKKNGHLFRECKEKVSRIFCFRCGKDDNLAPTCSNCFPTKNGEAALLSEQSAPESEDSN